MKHTSKSNADYRKLEEALKAIKEVMTHINEDKRRTEGQLAMFDIFNDIDNCPVSYIYCNIYYYQNLIIIIHKFIAPLSVISPNVRFQVRGDGALGLS